ncbi:acyl-CoA thioesterase [Granulibacter bethesdensis]|uniref:acyl-CoA thioesterase n=1 Tax=Granulibacter bethesdensis TaxID=364410 RepID=UPI00090A0D44|nr:thioesterase family protein [Granulibacter bethesdensis]APH58596.1 Thioesterase [Granulibacter bethesdensis]
MTQPDPASSVCSPDEFHAWIEDTVRFGDTDAQGHVNNVTFARYAETGYVPFMRAAGLLSDPGRMAVAARIEIDFRSEIFYPAVVRIGTALDRIGRSSITLRQGLFVETLCVATVRLVLVLIDRNTRRPLVVDDALIARLRALSEGLSDQEASLAASRAT